LLQCAAGDVAIATYRKNRGLVASSLSVGSGRVSRGTKLELLPYLKLAFGIFFFTINSYSDRGANRVLLCLSMECPFVFILLYLGWNTDTAWKDCIQIRWFWKERREMQMAQVHFVVNAPKTRNFEIWPQVQRALQAQEVTQTYTSRDSDKTSYAGT